ncbi:alpha/beta hydrolase [Roseivirga sp. E12]|uniref:alpha/beta hydrolase n=1 Tax=Roseivirga sp. E12 TaxID=2819237 RepID=UPI001ABC83B6|nr:alpha/beta hydrolase-fold protein [Roseivirga sp. E12]MBO3697716.1 alpha/beta hydrolase [Roseivirga sp. E12]
MKLKKTQIAVLSCMVLMLFGQSTLSAQTKPVQLANTEQFTIKSSSVDDDFEISVSLPFGYAQSETTYKVLYILDANVTFGMAHDIQTLISFEPENPPMIIVGIGYKDFGNWIQKRARDYMPSKVISAPGSGGADKFMAFLEKELIPKVKEKYRTTEEKIIYGHSTAGLFGLYALMTKPEMFDGYIITSPSVDEDNGYALSQLNSIESFPNKSARVFTSYGTKEKQTFADAYKAFIKVLKNKAAQDIVLKSQKFDASHMASMAPAFVAGLQFVNKSN